MLTDTNGQINITLSESQLNEIVEEVEKRTVERVERKIRKRMEENKKRDAAYTYREVAAMLKISHDALKKRVYRGEVIAHFRDTNEPLILYDDLLHYFCEVKGMFKKDALKLIDSIH